MDTFSQRFQLITFTRVILIATNIVTHVASVKVSKIAHSHEDPPEIWLSSYVKPDSFRELLSEEQFRSHSQFTNEFISKNKSDYVVNNEIPLVAFACEANYPITWNFPYPEQLKHINYNSLNSKEYRSSNLTSNSEAPTNTKFKILLGLIFSSSLRVGGIAFVSLNITCTSTENRPPIQSSVYVYYIGEQMIESEGETLQVFQEFSSMSPSRDLQFVIPCRPASPDIKLRLEKQLFVRQFHGNSTVTDEEMWTVINLATFDPKIGFSETITNFYHDDELYGLYRCSVVISSEDGNGDIEEVDSSQFVLVNVTNDRNVAEKSSNKSIRFEPRSIIRGSASVSLERINLYSHMRCCSGVPETPPILLAWSCTDPLQCEFLKSRILVDIGKNEKKGKRKHPLSWHSRFNDPSDCAETYLHPSSVVVVCQGNDLDFAEQYVSLFDSEIGGSLSNRSKRVLEHQNKEKFPKYMFHDNIDQSQLSLSRYHSLSVADFATPSEKMFLTVGRQLSTTQISKMRKRVQTGSPISVRIPNFAAGDTIINNDVYDEVENLQNYSPAESLERYYRILEYKRDVYFVGEPLIFMCFGIPYFYSGFSKFGAHLRLNWENGTKTILESEIEGGGVDKTKNEGYIRKLYRLVYLNGGGGNLAIWGGRGSIFGETILAQAGMISVDCWMAVRNSSAWDKISRQFKVVSSVAPRFVEKEEETLNFYLGENGPHVVTCTVVDSKPFPKSFEVIKDGKALKFDVNHKNSRNLDFFNRKIHLSGNSDLIRKVDIMKGRIALTFDFGVIKHDIHGVYKCIATNVNGTARRTIKVFVIEKPSKSISISLSVAGVFFLVLGVLALKHWRDTKIVSTLRTNTT